MQTQSESLLLLQTDFTLGGDAFQLLVFRYTEEKIKMVQQQKRNYKLKKEQVGKSRDVNNSSLQGQSGAKVKTTNFVKKKKY